MYGSFPEENTEKCLGSKFGNALKFFMQILSYQATHFENVLL